MLCPLSNRLDRFAERYQDKSWIFWLIGLTLDCTATWFQFHFPLHVAFEGNPINSYLIAQGWPVFFLTRIIVFVILLILWHKYYKRAVTIASIVYLCWGIVFFLSIIAWRIHFCYLVFPSTKSLGPFRHFFDQQPHV